MVEEQSTDEIRKVALTLDSGIENKNLDTVISCFADNCEIELLRHSLIFYSRNLSSGHDCTAVQK